MVESLGYATTLEGDPTSIVAAVGRERPDLVLQAHSHQTDLAAMLAALRLDPATADVPVVFVDGPQRPAAYDASGHLTNAFDEDELEALLRQALSPRPDAPKRWADVHLAVRGAFHDYRNLLAALCNYVQVLQHADIGAKLQTLASTQGLEELVLRLESKTDRLRSFALATVDVVVDPGLTRNGRPPPA